jgi:CRP-like cAMP-binding protein
MYTFSQADRLAILALGMTLAGCAGVTPVPYSAVASSSYLAPNPSDASGNIPYRYSTAVDWRTYNKVIIEPVVIYRGPDQQFADMSEEDKVSLASYMQTRFTEKLGRRFTLVNQRGPNTVRVRLTLTGAVANTPVLGTLSRFDLAGAVYNGVQAARDGEGSMTGSVIYAVEIFDAATSRLLGAFVSKQYPSPLNIKASVGSLAAAEAGLDKGADTLVAQLK